MRGLSGGGQEQGAQGELCPLGCGVPHQENDQCVTCYRYTCGGDCMHGHQCCECDPDTETETETETETTESDGTATPDPPVQEAGKGKGFDNSTANSSNNRSTYSISKTITGGSLLCTTSVSFMSNVTCLIL